MAATGSTWIDIAAATGRADRTLSLWKLDPDFKAELTKQREAYLKSCMETARRDIQSLAVEAVECLRKAMKNGSVKAALAIAAGTGALKPPTITTEEKITVEFGEVTLPKEPDGKPAE